jgi:hypothetical protein
MSDPGSTPKNDEPGNDPAEAGDARIDSDSSSSSHGASSAFDPDSWFGSQPDGIPLSPDFVDPELARLNARPSVLQLLLVLVVMGFAGFLAATLYADVAYFFSDDAPLDLGAVEEMAAELAANPSLLESLQSNQYVRVSGIPQRRSVAGDRQWAQLVGAPIFVESVREDPGADPILRDVRFRIAPNEEPLRRYYLATEGRLMRFEDLGRRYDGLIEFYRDGYNLWFCGQPLTRRQEDYRQLTVNELRVELGREPTTEEVDQSFHCENAFLVQADRKPADHAWHLAVVAFIALIQLAGLWYVVRWVVRMRAFARA